VNNKYAQNAEASHCAEEDAQGRARKVAELKRKVQSGTYLIKQYEIIEGLLNSMNKTLD